MEQVFDYVIIGAGPVGLTLSLLLKEYNILLIDKNDSIGGCHSVKRIDGYFTEHGPRIYLDNYLMLQRILQHLNTSFTELFTLYDFNISNIGGHVFNNISFIDMLKLAFAFITLNISFKQIILKDYLYNNCFTSSSINYIDRLCRLTDGGGIDKFTLYQFLQILNQNALYNTYQPKLPNDHKDGLFGKWYSTLKNNNVTIMLNQEVTHIHGSITKIDYIKLKSNKIIRGKRFILAIPPEPIIKILQNNQNNNSIKNTFGSFNSIKEWSVLSSYDTYISIIFHWPTKIKLPKIWGFPSTSWGLAHIVLSDYIDFDSNNSKTVISTIITKNDTSEHTNKKPLTTINKQELINETFRQLQISYPNLPNSHTSFISQNVLNNQGIEWKPLNHAFMNTIFGYLQQESQLHNNLWNCGTHNGHSNYSFTSMESAIINAITLAHKLEPNTKITHPIRTAIELRSLIILIVIILIIYFHFLL